jgi:hypothetical protein
MALTDRSFTTGRRLVDSRIPTTTVARWIIPSLRIADSSLPITRWGLPPSKGKNNPACVNISLVSWPSRSQNQKFGSILLLGLGMEAPPEIRSTLTEKNKHLNGFCQDSMRER